MLRNIKKFNSDFGDHSHGNYISMSDLALDSKFEFIEKYGSASHMRDQDCYICGGNDFKHLNSLDRYGFYYPTGVCKSCGNIQQTKYYDEKATEAFYTNYYRNIYDPESPTERFIYQKNVIGENIISFIKDFDFPKSVLEIGCGSGGILKAFQLKGAKVLGLDYDIKFINEGKNNGVDIRQGSIEVLDQSEKFECIIINHVLEHIVDPKLMLESLKRHLSENGIIYIEVPSVNSLLMGMYGSDLQQYFQNAHTIHFTNHSLNNLALSCGYDIHKQDNFIRSIWRESNSNQNIKISNYYDDSLFLINATEQNRASTKMKLARTRNHIRLSILYILDFFGVKNFLKKVLRGN